QCDEQPERAVPLHVLRRSLFDSGLDEVEIEYQVERGDHDDECAEEDPHRSTLVNEPDRSPEKPHHETDHVQDEDGSRRRDHTELEVLGGLDQSTAIGREKAEERTESETDRLDDDAGKSHLERRRDTTEREPLEKC